ncbi:MAG: hypothetical protein GXP47_11795, partial [Acidobacteria bacterium]|nr:hypothetical protein [Acidobacteriota bacterium]
MDPRQLLLILRADLVQAGRRTLWAGPGRLLAGIGGAIGLAAAEIWAVHRLAGRLLSLPPPLDAMAPLFLDRGMALVAQLGFAVALTSAVTLALPQVEHLEGDAFSAALPVPAALRGVQGLWRTAAGLVWAAVLLLPLVVTAALAPVHGPGTAFRITVALLALLLTAAGLGTAVAVALAALIPRRILLPAAWTGATAAVVGAILWLRHLRPEKLFLAPDLPSILLALGSGAAAQPPRPGRWLAAAAG